MSTWLFLFGFWFSLIIGDVSSILLFSIPYLLSLLVILESKKKIWIGLLAIGLAAMYSMYESPKATVGVYSIIEIKDSYCLGKKDKSVIVIYGLEDANYYDQVDVRQLEPIQSLKNLYGFQFETFMHQQGIHYQTNVTQKDICFVSRSIQSKIYSKLKNQSIYRRLFYQQSQDKDSNIIERLGLPILGIFTFVHKRLKRFSLSVQMMIMSTLMAVYMIIFPVPMSLFRYFVFLVSSFLIQHPHRRLQFSILFFLLIQPRHASSFVFVFPVLYKMVTLLKIEKVQKKMVQKVVLLVCQFIYFHQVDFLFLFLFQPLRKLYGMIALASICPGVSRVVFLVYPLFQKAMDQIPRFSWHYAPGVFFYLLGILWLCKPRKWILALLCLFPFLQYPLDPFFHVYMLDVGQGDCTLIVEPFRKSVVMIDCAGNLYRDNVEQIVYPFLQAIQANRIDALIVTHEDFDHNGGVEQLKKKIQVKNIIQQSDQDIPVDYPFLSLQHQKGDGSENDSSIVSYFTYDGMKFVWMADAGIEVEKELMQTYDLDADVLKLGHHGSSTSSDFSFLEKVQPQLGLISVGAKNRYRHPSSQVIANCKTLGIHTLQTKDVGMIHIFTWKAFRFFECANGIFGIIHL